MSKVKNVPEIRFKGFSGEWKLFSLGELGSVATNKRIFIHQTSLIGDVPFYKIGTFGREPRLFISQELFEDYKKLYPFPEKGDLLFSVIGSIGRVVEYTGENEYFQDSNIVWLKHDGAIVNSFLKQFYSIVEWEGIEGSTIKHLYNRTILGTKIQMPSKEEQTQIGNTFQKLDNLINQHQQKHDKLSNIKKAMLEKMFPKQGETIPEIRFKGFSGEWEEIELSDEVTFINGRAYSQEELLDKGKYTVLRVGNFYTNSSWYYSDLELGDKYYADNGDLLYTWSASFGPHIWNGDKVIYHYHIWKLELSENIDKLFLLHLLDYDRAKILSGSNGSTMIHITKSAMEAKKAFIPKKDEQIVIGNYFQKLDQLIKQHQQQITKLTNIKQACLSKMFV